MKQFFAEFKKFITRGNVVDMSVGVIVGAAFTAIVTALTDHILRPLINFLISLAMGDAAAESVYTMLKPVYDANGDLLLDSSIYIDWGAFVGAIVNFLLIAFILFLIVKAINKVAQAGESVKADITARAQAEAADIVEKARGAIEAEKKAAIADLQGAVADTSVALTARLIGNDLDEAQHRKIIEHYMDEAGSFNGN